MFNIPPLFIITTITVTYSQLVFLYFKPLCDFQSNNVSVIFMSSLYLLTVSYDMVYHYPTAIWLKRYYTQNEIAYYHRMGSYTPNCSTLLQPITTVQWLPHNRISNDTHSDRANLLCKAFTETPPLDIRHHWHALSAEIALARNKLRPHRVYI